MDELKIESALQKHDFPQFLGASGHVDRLEDAKCKIVYRDLNCLKTYDSSSSSLKIVHRTMPFDLKPFSFSIKE